MNDICSTLGCGRKRAYRSGACNSCYYRVKRTGTLAKRPKKKRVPTSHGYVRVWRRGHPMADRTGTGYEHRVNLYDAIGPGPHPCFWCGEVLTWKKIHVDHSNGVKTDNRPDNLLVACTRCNKDRGAALAMVKRLTPAARVVFLANLSGVTRASF